jgi:hypothetical protein
MRRARALGDPLSDRIVILHRRSVAVFYIYEEPTFSGL